MTADANSSKRKHAPVRLFTRRLDLKQGRVDLTHGAGAKASAQLVREIFMPAFGGQGLAKANDQATVPIASDRLVVTTDGFVVSPLFFPGGDIGELAVHGTVNDLAMGAAKPLYMTCTFIIEEGFPLADLARIAQSMGEAARDSGIEIVAGDTKVVERGKGDGVFISATGIGVLPEHVTHPPSAERATPGDAVIVSGPIAEHGTAVMLTRAELPFTTPIVSDSAPLHELVATMIDSVANIHVLRDPTRGGVAAALNEIAIASATGIILNEERIPIGKPVAAACEVLGIDPLTVASEGRLIAICSPADAPTLLASMRSHPRGRDAEIVGEVVADERHFVQMRTRFGGTRLVDWLTGDQLPRIC